MKNPKARPQSKRDSRRKKRSTRLSESQLDALMSQAVVDCYGDAEQAMGLFVMIEKNLKILFETRFLGVPEEVVAVDIRDQANVVAVCKRGRECQAVSLLDLPLPTPKPEGAERIEAYRRGSRVS